MVSFRLQPNYPILRNLKEIVAILLSLVQPLTKKGFKSERFFVIFPDICFNITQRPFGKKNLPIFCKRPHATMYEVDPVSEVSNILFLAYFLPGKCGESRFNGPGKIGMQP